MAIYLPQLNKPVTDPVTHTKFVQEPTPAQIEAYSDRSTCVTHQKCPRLRWYQHEHPNGTPAPGVVTNTLDINLTLGSAYHVGMFHLLQGAGLEEAVGRMLEGDAMGWEGYWPMVRRQEFKLEEGEDGSYVYYEQAALAEALVRGYYYYALPRLLDTYEVLETEYDEQAYFSDPTVPNFRLRWGIRTDGLLRDKETDFLYVLSHKTAKQWNGEKSERNNRYDMQGLTEMASVEQRLKKWQALLDEGAAGKIEPNGDFIVKGVRIPRWFRDRRANGGEPEVAGVKMEFAIKGYRSEYPKGSKKWVYSNSLIRPYRRAEDGLLVKRRTPKGGGPGNAVVGDYALDWSFTDELGGSHTLGKGWKVINIWEDMGVKNWIEYCLENEIQGKPQGFALERQFVLPVEYSRNPDDLKRKIRQLVNQEYRVQQGRDACLGALETDPTRFIEKLDIHFPQQMDYPHSCTYCPMEIVCHGPDAYKFNPLAHPIFAPRTPNHGKAELVQIGE